MSYVRCVTRHIWRSDNRTIDGKTRRLCSEGPAPTPGAPERPMFRNYVLGLSGVQMLVPRVSPWVRGGPVAQLLCGLKFDASM